MRSYLIIMLHFFSWSRTTRVIMQQSILEDMTIGARSKRWTLYACDWLESWNSFRDNEIMLRLSWELRLCWYPDYTPVHFVYMMSDISCSTQLDYEAIVNRLYDKYDILECWWSVYPAEMVCQVICSAWLARQVATIMRWIATCTSLPTRLDLIHLPSSVAILLVLVFRCLLNFCFGL